MSSGTQHDPNPLASLIVTAMLVAAATGYPLAQSRPLPTETIDVIGEGNASLAVATDYARDVQYPLSGLQGDLWRVALIRIVIGVSDIADFELSGGLRDRLSIASQSRAPLADALVLKNPKVTSAFDDIVVGTKVRLFRPRDARPGVAVHIATRLPNAKHPSGLGQDTMDFYGSAIVGAQLRRIDVNASTGLGVLGDPLRGNRRVRSLLYGAIVSWPLGSSTTFVTRIDGRTGPDEPGLESRSIARAGIAWANRPLRFGIDGTVGLTPRDGGLGVSVTANYVFHAFTLTR